MIELLKTRFESNRIHRGELSWAVVLARLEAHPEALDALRWMEESGGEPDVIGTDGERILFADCAKESPAGRRSLCYDETARKARKEAFNAAGGTKLPTIKELRQEYAQLIVQKKEAYKGYRGANWEMQELLKARQNVEQFYGDYLKKEREAARQQRKEL